MYFAQWWEVKKGRIPPKSKSFLYLEGFNTSGWGDVIGLTMVDICVGALIVHGWTINFLVPTILFAVAGIMGTVLFAMMCLRRNHKPDAGYPAAGKISWQGRVHLVYFAFQITYGVLGIVLLINTFTSDVSSDIAWYIVIGLSGLALYAIAFVLDLKQGKFASIS